MIIKATLGTLIIILIIVIMMSYYVNKEGFDDITNKASILPGVPTPKPILPGVPTPDSQPAQTKPILPGVPTPTSDSTSPQRVDIVPEVSISGSGYDAMSLQQRADLLRDIQKAVRNELLANRVTTPLIPATANKPSESTAQGKEYEDSCYKDTEYRCPKNPDGSCPPMPDMSQYIKKDAIPCYGCSLDY